MNNLQKNTQMSDSLVSYTSSTDNLKKLPWSLALALIPFVPDILETIRSLPDKIAKNGYALHIKHNQTDICFNKADMIYNSIKEVPFNDEKNK